MYNYYIVHFVKFTINLPEYMGSVFVKHGNMNYIEIWKVIFTREMILIPQIIVAGCIC